MDEWKRARVASATVAAAMVLLTGCAEEANRNQSGGTGLPFGSAKEDYQAAFEKVDPITINMQSSSAKGALSGRKFEDYAAAVTDWSNGKITFDIAYSNAIAPPQEVDNALRDGRLDIGSPLPLYEPAEFPANNNFVSSMVIGQQSPVVGLLQMQGWITEIGYETPEIVQEFENNGMHMLLPAFSAGSTGLLCRDAPRNTLTSVRGAEVGIASTAMSKQVQALGATPISVVYTETFESLQRGIIDCTTAIMGAAVLGGFVSEAPYIVLDEEVGFGAGPGALAISNSLWNDLPLIAQQLLFDRLDVFLGSNFGATWENIAEASVASQEAGGSIAQFDEAARAALVAANKETLNDVRQSGAFADGDGFLNSALEASTRWGSDVDALGYVDDVGYSEFEQWYRSQSIDLDPYFSRLLGEALIEYRPS
ncbi:TRAP transporter substrate-binding protein DctP [Rhodococcus aetherivorans]